MVKLLLNSYQTSTDGINKVKINRGAPQGSIISPILFNIVINDLIKEVKEEFGEEQITLAYADDLLFIIHGKVKVKKLISIVENWCRKNHMSINYNKSGIFKI